MKRLWVSMGLLCAVLASGPTICLANQLQGEVMDLTEARNVLATAWNYGTEYGMQGLGVVLGGAGLVSLAKNRRESGGGTITLLGGGALAPIYPSIIGGSKRIAPAAVGALTAPDHPVVQVLQGFAGRDRLTDPLFLACLLGLVLVGWAVRRSPRTA